MVSLRSRCQWLIIPDRFKWTLIRSQSRYYTLDLTQYGVRMEVYNKLASRARVTSRLVWPPTSFGPH